MIDFKNLTPADVARACQEAIDACEPGVDAIVAMPAGERTFDNTLIALESAVDHVQQAGGQVRVHGVRRARRCAARHRPRVGAEARQVRRRARASARTSTTPYASLRRRPRPPRSQARRSALLDRTLRDYRRNGFELPKEQRERVQALMNRLVELGTSSGRRSTSGTTASSSSASG